MPSRPTSSPALNQNYFHRNIETDELALEAPNVAAGTTARIKFLSPL
jgi:hypothetical protein